MWEVLFTSKALKKKDKLPSGIKLILITLIREIEIEGPYRHNWPNFGKVEKNKYHCHLKKGKPTYVACWEIINKEIKITEVYYVGTHEKAPY